ncbi:hypothetical protein CT3_31910 [Comamonas terrigena NBRC 13299]|nr:hypothetical protein CT3_31910 [Comamonas terrigena NBRC 13299]
MEAGEEAVMEDPIRRDVRGIKPESPGALPTRATGALGDWALEAKHNQNPIS